MLKTLVSLVALCGLWDRCEVRTRLWDTARYEVTGEARSTEHRGSTLPAASSMLSPATWTPAGPIHPHVVPCATCPTGYRYSGYQGRWYRRGETWAYALSDGDGKPVGWWIYDETPPRWIPASRDAREAAALAPLTEETNRRAIERYHWRLSPGRRGMLGCTVHGGGWDLVPD